MAYGIFFFLPLAGLFTRAGFSPQIFSKILKKWLFQLFFKTETAEKNITKGGTLLWKFPKYFFSFGKLSALSKKFLPYSLKVVINDFFENTLLFFFCLAFPLIVPLNEKMIAFPALINVFMTKKKKLRYLPSEMIGGYGKSKNFIIGRAISIDGMV